MTTERIAVFDILGPMYHYDPRGWTNGAVEGLLIRLERHKYVFTNDNEAAQAEEDLQKSGREEIYIMPGFAETVLYLREQKVRPVVVSAGTPWVLEHTVELAAREYSARAGRHLTREQLVAPTDLVSTVPIGSKKDPQTWRRAVQPYAGAEVIAVYEDTFANLTAAMPGVTPQVGYHVTSTQNGLARLCRDERIYRGHMLEVLEHLQKEVLPK